MRSSPAKSGTGIADRPVDQVELGIVGARHPRRAASMLERLADPGFGSRFSALRNRVEAPYPLARRRAIRIEKSARAFFSAGHADDQQIADRQRRRRRAVRVDVRAHLRFPEPLAGEAVEAEHVCVVGDHEDTIADDRRASIHADARLADDAAMTRLLVRPQRATRRRVNRLNLVPARDIHDAVDHDRRRLRAGLGHRKRPNRREPLDVRCVDLIERAVAVAGKRAVIQRPVALWRDRFLAVYVAIAREQRELRVVVLEQDCRGHRLAQQDSRARTSVGHLDGRRFVAADARRNRPRLGWRKRLGGGGAERLPVYPPVAIAGLVPASFRISESSCRSSASGIAAGTP